MSKEIDSLTPPPPDNRSRKSSARKGLRKFFLILFVLFHSSVSKIEHALKTYVYTYVNYSTVKNNALSFYYIHIILKRRICTMLTGYLQHFRLPLTILFF